MHLIFQTAVLLKKFRPLFVIIYLYIELINKLLRVRNYVFALIAFSILSCGAPKSFVKTGMEVGLLFL